MGSPPRTSSSPPPPPPSATASLASQKMNYTATASSFPSTTDAWMTSRPSVSPLKTADEGHFRSSSSSFYAATNGPPSPPPSLAASTPRGQWLADSGRRASYSAPYPSSASYAPSNGHGGPLGSPHDEQWSPAGYSPTTYLPPPGHGHHHHYAQGQPSQAPQAAQPPYPQPVPLPQPTAISSIPMPIPLGQQQPRRRGKLPKATTEYLKDWLHKHAEHPYPTEDEKKRLCAVTGLSMSQVSNWMINARRRILAPARANAAPAAAAPPYGAPPQPAPYAHGPVIPRPPSGDSATSRSDGGLMYTPNTQPQSYPPLQPMPVHPASAGNSPPHRSSWPAPSSAPLSAAPSSSTSYFPPPPDGTASRGSPHSTHSEHLLPTPGADTNSQ